MQFKIVYFLDSPKMYVLVPAPDSRVLLLSSIPESTYINANYIKVWKVDLRPVHICYATVLGL